MRARCGVEKNRTCPEAKGVFNEPIRGWQAGCFWLGLVGRGSHRSVGMVGFGVSFGLGSRFHQTAASPKGERRVKIRLARTPDDTLWRQHWVAV